MTADEERAHYDRTVAAARRLSELAKEHMPENAAVLMIVGLTTDDPAGFPVVLAGNVEKPGIAPMLRHALASVELAERTGIERTPFDLGGGTKH